MLDVLMKNESSRSDMIDIMKCMQDYLGKEYPSERRVPSGGDQQTCERQVGAQRHTMDGDTIQDRLGILEPVMDDWHCLVFPLRKSACNHSIDHHTCAIMPIHTCYIKFNVIAVFLPRSFQHSDPPPMPLIAFFLAAKMIDVVTNSAQTMPIC